MASAKGSEVRFTVEVLVLSGADGDNGCFSRLLLTRLTVLFSVVLVNCIRLKLNNRNTTIAKTI